MTPALKSIAASPAWRAFWRGENDLLLILPDGATEALPPHSAPIVSGSFNPLHEGHRKLAQVAAQLLNAQPIFELSIANVDKPHLDQDEVLRRLEQFINYNPIAITRAATFDKKALLLKGCVFVLGFDTAERTLSPKYYPDQEAMRAALATVAQQGNRFLVACRLINGKLKTLADLAPPPEFASLFRAIPPDLFRVDLSSTQLRAQIKSMKKIDDGED